MHPLWLLINQNPKPVNNDSNKTMFDALADFHWFFAGFWFLCNFNVWFFELELNIGVFDQLLSWAHTH
jgi:hypothetical protein